MSLLYFSYGSNMLTQRMHINCTSAIKKCIAELKNYKLIFCDFSVSWKGAVASITKSQNTSVWGVVWEISQEDLLKLDKQESKYKPLAVVVESPSLGQLKCRSYQHLKNTNIDQPSLIYKKVIFEGAEEHKLPLHYKEILKNVPDNGYKGPVDIPVNIHL